MVKTTVYLPEELKQRVRNAAALEGRSEAEVIRAALLAYTAPQGARRPRAPLFQSGQADLADRVDEHLAGFGER